MIPDFQTLMLPILKVFADNKEHRLDELTEIIFNQFKITEDEKSELLTSGQPIINNRIGWAKTYLSKAGLLTSTQRAIYKITEFGLKVLKSNPDKINIKYLKDLPNFKDWTNTFKTKDQSEIEEIEENEIISEKTPQELLDLSYQKLHEELAIELLDKIKSGTPVFFERLVVDLLIKMGYGGSRKDAGQIVGKSGDGGIDGIIKEDKLGLDVIYIQAKKWEQGSTVGRPEIQKFVGALAGQGAKKGIFITTTNFTKDALEYSPRNETKIVLIDGKELAKLMIENNVGIAVKNIYEIKKIDIDYFEEL